MELWYTCHSIGTNWATVGNTYKDLHYHCKWNTDTLYRLIALMGWTGGDPYQAGNPVLYRRPSAADFRTEFTEIHRMSRQEALPYAAAHS